MLFYDLDQSNDLSTQIETIPVAESREHRLPGITLDKKTSIQDTQGMIM